MNVVDAVSEVKIGSENRCTVPANVVDKLRIRKGERIKVTIDGKEKVEVKVGSNYRFTVPADIAKKLGIKKGDVIRMKFEKEVV